MNKDKVIAYLNCNCDFKVGVTYNTYIQAVAEPIDIHPTLLHKQYYVVELSEPNEINYGHFSAKKFKVLREISVQEWINIIIDRFCNKYPNKPYDNNQQIDVADKINAFVKSNADFARIRGNCRNNADIVSIGKDARIETNNPLARIISTGDFSKITVKGTSSIVASNGKSARIESKGEKAIILSNGDNATIDSTEVFNRIISNGTESNINSYDAWVRILSHGARAHIFSIGDNAIIYSEGNSSVVQIDGASCIVISDGIRDVIVSSNYASTIKSNGSHSQICCTGYGAEIVSSGDYTRILAANTHIQIDSQGTNCTIVCHGEGSVVKAKKGSYITLTEYTNDEYEPIIVKTERVDGVRIKEDTWYTIKDGEFVVTKPIRE